MTTQIPGIHHVTAIASDPQENIRFHTEVLGLRLVKRTVNFDAPGTYHLYYGDETGTPGTIMTFFPGRNTPGTVGRGQTSATAYVVPEGSLPYWRDRLDDHGVTAGEPVERFGERVLPFTDADGQPYELVTGASDIEPWDDGPVPASHAIRGFHGVTLDSLAPERTGEVLGTMGYERVGSESADEAIGSESEPDGTRTRYRAPGERAAVVDVLDRPDGERGVKGAGTVHHVAFRTPDDETQARWRETLTDAGLRVTPQKDRRYFRSIYFREEGGVLFEIATEGPGFTRDESVETLGSLLQLPPWLEDDRETIESALQPLSAGEAAR